MISKLFNIKDDSILVAKERVVRWTYKKYPPKSKYILWKNIKTILLLIIVMSIGICSMFYFDKYIDWTYYLLSLILMLPLGSLIYDTVKEWKHGKYWE